MVIDKRRGGGGVFAEERNETFKEGHVDGLI